MFFQAPSKKAGKKVAASASPKKKGGKATVAKVCCAFPIVLSNGIENC